MKYGIGLDCGITSVGYAVTELDFNDEPSRIVKLGARVFDCAEQPKTGESLAKPRRDARGIRRRIRRHQHRLERIRYMLVCENIVNEEELENMYSGQLSDIYELRTKALDEPINNVEFARILINLAQRRGFKSNRKSETKDKEKGLLLKAIDDNNVLMTQKGYRTVGEMLCKDEKFSECKRNKGEDYKNTVSRDMIAQETALIFDSQRRFSKAFADELIEEKYKEILLSQRSFAIGPGEGPENSRSIYAGNQIEKMIGKCTFYPEEFRAAKATYSFQLFNLLQKINNITLINEYGEKLKLSQEERLKIEELCVNKSSVNYAAIRKQLNISDAYRFNISYADKNFEDVEKKTKFEYLKQYHQMKKILGDIVKVLSQEQLDCIGGIFTMYRDDEIILSKLKETDIDPTFFNVLLNLPEFSGYGHISIKACKQIIPFLKQGMTYDKACESAGIDFRSHLGEQRSKLLPCADEVLANITNPVVKRAVVQTRKVVNAIIREMGNSPAYINVELARELSKNRKDRAEIEKTNTENHNQNERIKQEIIDNFGIAPRGQDIVKLKLYHEQNGICPYSQKAFEYDRLFEDGYVDVDHIIPYSLSFDDSYNNKVLTFSYENKQKSNRIPMDYIKDEKKSDYCVWVNGNVKNIRKREKLLKTKLSEEESRGLKARSLKDTQYLSRVIYNYLNDNLIFDEYKYKTHVSTVNGAATAYIRKRWGISKIREDGDLHHGVDAAVIACITKRMEQNIAKYSKYHETDIYDVDEITGEVIERFPMPYPEFRKELDIRATKENQESLETALKTLSNYSPENIRNTKPSFVSRMPKHKVSGAAHEETIRSAKSNKKTVSKKLLSDLKLNKDGEIIGYYNPTSDLLLYNAIKYRLQMFGGNGKEAFPQGFVFHKPKSDGSEGPIVKKVKIEENASLTVPVNNGVAANGSMIRIDVFYVKNEGYYFIPIYVADTVKSELPDLACVGGGREWKKMNEEDFVFSLYSNDLIKIVKKTPLKFTVKQKGSSLQKEIFRNEIYTYYVGADISTASISVRTHDNAYESRGNGIKSLISIEKYTVDPIGNINKVGREKRMRFN